MIFGTINKLKRIIGGGVTDFIIGLVIVENKVAGTNDMFSFNIGNNSTADFFLTIDRIGALNAQEIDISFDGTNIPGVTSANIEIQFNQGSAVGISVDLSHLIASDAGDYWIKFSFKLGGIAKEITARVRAFV